MNWTEYNRKALVKMQRQKMQIEFMIQSRLNLQCSNQCAQASSNEGHNSKQYIGHNKLRTGLSQVCNLFQVHAIPNHTENFASKVQPTFFVPPILTLLISSGLRDKLTTPSDKSKTRPLTEDPTSRVLPLTG